MKRYQTPPNELPDEPALIREATGEYAIWTGRNWLGSLARLGREWHVETKGRPVMTYSYFQDAVNALEFDCQMYEGSNKA